MAQAQTMRFAQFLIKIGTGAGSPEVFDAPCGVTSKGFNRTAALNETNVPDCDDPDLPAWLERDIVSNSAEMALSGVVDDGDFDVWDTWFNDGSTKNVQVILGTRVWQGAMVLGTLNLTGERGTRVTFEASLSSAGEMERIV